MIIERGIFFHPEDKFSAETAHISEEEASVWNRLLDECNAVCTANGTDLYDIIIPLSDDSRTATTFDRPPTTV